MIKVHTRGQDRDPLSKRAHHEGYLHLGQTPAEGNLLRQDGKGVEKRAPQICHADPARRAGEASQ